MDKNVHLGICIYHMQGCFLQREQKVVVNIVHNILIIGIKHYENQFLDGKYHHHRIPHP